MKKFFSELKAYLATKGTMSVGRLLANVWGAMVLGIAIGTIPWIVSK